MSGKIKMFLPFSFIIWVHKLHSRFWEIWLLYHCISILGFDLNPSFPGVMQVFQSPNCGKLSCQIHSLINDVFKMPSDCVHGSLWLICGWQEIKITLSFRICFDADFREWSSDLGLKMKREWMHGEEPPFCKQDQGFDSRTNWQHYNLWVETPAWKPLSLVLNIYGAFLPQTLYGLMSW